MADKSELSTDILDAGGLEKVRMSLRPGFRFIYRALNEKDFYISNFSDSHYFSRLPHLKEKLKKFIRSEGGCILICGHMGVGKTSFVNGILSELKNDQSLKIIDIHINVARPIDPTRLKFKILRRLRKEFSNRNDHVFKQIETSYLKTFFGIKETTTEGKTSSTELGFEGDPSKMLVSPKLMGKKEKTTTKGIELVLGEYDDIEAEEDIQNIIDGLSDWYVKQPLHSRVWKGISSSLTNSKERIAEWLLGRKKLLKLIIILDELDKLDNKKEDEVENLIESLKNIFTSSNTSFVLISGHRTLDKIEEQFHNDIETIFGGMISGVEYMPCMWEEIRSMAYWVVDEDTIPKSAVEWYKTDFQDYLVYVSRGNFRQFFRALADYTKSTELEFDRQDIQRISKIAQLQRYIDKRVFLISEQDDQNHRDKKRLEAYRITDYIINLEPGEILTIESNQFSHQNTWLGRAIPPQSPKFGVELENLIRILQDLEYVSTVNESEPIVDNSIKSKLEPRQVSKKFRVTGKVYELRRLILELTEDTDRNIKRIQGTDPGLLHLNQKDLFGGIVLSSEEMNQYVLAQIICPYCRTEIKKDDTLIICKNCRTVHHLACWRIYKGCTALGCIYNSYLT